MHLFRICSSNLRLVDGLVLFLHFSIDRRSPSPNLVVSISYKGIHKDVFYTQDGRGTGIQLSLGDICPCPSKERHWITSTGIMIVIKPTCSKSLRYIHELILGSHPLASWRTTAAFPSQRFVTALTVELCIDWLQEMCCLLIKAILHAYWHINKASACQTLSS